MPLAHPTNVGRRAQIQCCSQHAAPIRFTEPIFPPAVFPGSGDRNARKNNDGNVVMALTAALPASSRSRMRRALTQPEPSQIAPGRGMEPAVHIDADCTRMRPDIITGCIEETGISRRAAVKKTPRHVVIQSTRRSDHKRAVRRFASSARRMPSCPRNIGPIATFRPHGRPTAWEQKPWRFAKFAATITTRPFRLPDRERP